MNNNTKEELSELEAKTKAEVIIAYTEYGKDVIYSQYKPSDYDVINKWFRNGQLTEQFLNAKNISDYIFRYNIIIVLLNLLYYLD